MFWFLRSNDGAGRAHPGHHMNSVARETRSKDAGGTARSEAFLVMRFGSSRLCSAAETAWALGPWPDLQRYGGGSREQQGLRASLAHAMMIFEDT